MLLPNLRILQMCVYLFVSMYVDSRTCSLAHCQYGCEKVEGEIRCLCPSAGLQLGQDERTCVGELPQSHNNRLLSFEAYGVMQDVSNIIHN